MCHDHSDLGRYPLVVPVGMDTQNTDPVASESRFGWFLARVGTPLYGLYTTGMCRWTGYGFSPLCRKGYMIS